MITNLKTLSIVAMVTGVVAVLITIVMLVCPGIAYAANPGATPEQIANMTWAIYVLGVPELVIGVFAWMKA